MSASKEKKNRFDQRGDGLGRKAAAAAEQEKKDRAFRRNTCITLLVIVVLVSAAAVINSPLLYHNTTALTVGDTRYSPAEVNYFFKTAYNKVYEQYSSTLGDSISSMLDTSKPLNTQQFSDDQTWADIIFEQAKKDITQATVYYDAAIRDGYAVNEDDKTQANSALEQMKTYADSNGFSSLNKFLAAYYGKGMNEALFLELSEKVALVSRYAEDTLNNLTYTDEELEEYYQANAEKMDYYSYYLYTISTSNEKFSELTDDEEKKTAAHDEAAKIAEAKTEEDFVKNVEAFAGEGSSISASRSHPSELGDSYKEWMMSEERKAGDTTVVDTDIGAYAIMYLGYDNNDYKTVAMRHILIKAEAAEDGSYTEEAKEAATQKIEELRAKWEEGDKTEDSFATLANENSDDDGSNTTGGLYEDIYKNQMVPGINDFLFAEERQPGDVEVIFNDGSYVGCHLVYFVGASENSYRLKLAKDAKTDEDYAANYEALSEGYEAVHGSGLRFANLA